MFLQPMGRVLWVVAVLLIPACSGESPDSTNPVQASPPPAACTEPVIIAASGQSNMLGSNQDTSGQIVTDPDVQVWNWSEWVVSEPNVYPPYGDSYVATNNAAHWLGIRIHEETGCPVGIILRAKGSTQITEWDTGQDEYLKFHYAIRDGLAALGETRVDIVFWGQGEIEHSTDETVYEETFFRFVMNLYGQAYMADTPPFLALSLPPGHDRQDWLYDNLADYPGACETSGRCSFDTDPVFVTVNTDGLDTDQTGVHWTGWSLQTIGYQRAWEALQKADGEGA